MTGPQGAFSSLGPIEWDSVPQDDLASFLDEVVTEAHITADSIPSPTASSVTSESPSSSSTDLQSSKTDATPKPEWPTPYAIENSRQLRPEWKEVKVNARENPLNVQVYKLSGKDGRGAWFARRSVHQGLTFDKWRDAMDSEFMESIKVQEGPGSGAIRGIGADRRVEHHTVPNSGNINVFQLSAQFPGPTAPRDFITLLLTCERSTTNPDFPRPLRQWIVVSKPCNHSDCPPRQGIIRGQYESIELIREVPAADPPSKLSASTPNLTQEKKAEDSTVKSSASDAGANDDEPPVAIEWLMVTRSDPGGSVPRFMIEKGTPPGIVNDAGKFLTWARRRSGDDPEQAEKALEEDAATNSADAAAPSESTKGAPAELGRKTVQSEVSESWGLWGMVTGAVGAASSVLKWQFSGADEDAESDSESLSGSDTSSVHSFASALEGSLASDQGSKSQAVSNSDVKSDEKSQAKGQHHKELRRLEERRRKLDEKVSKIAEEREAKILAGKEKEAAALAKSREKHEKEIAKQEVKYKNQLQKIEKRREQAEHKAEQRRKKAAEREQATNLKLEIDKTRAERDVALKKVQLLEAQVEQLQVENSKLKTAAGDGGSSSSNASGKPESSKS